MIPGFNTDIEHGGITYHVQTEDKGVESPIILSLVYQGGAILASKRTPYDDLLATGFDETTLAERLQRQHKLICAAIRTGRIEDLKRMNERAPASTAVESKVEAERKVEIAPPRAVVAASGHAEEEDDLLDLGPSIKTWKANPEAREEGFSARSTAHVLRDGVADFARHTTTADAPDLSLLEETPIRGGHDLSLRVKLTQGSGSAAVPVPAATITAKVLGTAFPKVNYTAQTDAEGIATVKLHVPAFSSGRAMLLISAIASGHEATLRRIVLPS